MSLGAFLVILLVWTVAGLLAAIAFGKAVRETNPDEEEGLAAAAGTVKYFRKSKSRATPEETPVARHDSSKRISG